MGLLKTLKPEWWFSAHLHTRFEALVVHGDQSPPVVQSSEGQNPDEIVIEDDDFDGEPTVASVIRNPDEITLDDEEDDVVAPPPPPPPRAETKFLALDKCLPRRQFLEVSNQVYATPCATWVNDWTFR